MRQIVLLTLILPSIILEAQVKELKKLNKGDVLIKYTPTSLIDLTFPKIEFGASYILDDKIGIQLKFAQKHDIFHKDDLFKNDGFKFSMEYQYLFQRKFYVAIENGILRNRFTDVMSYYVSETDNTVIDDEYHAINEKVFMVFKFGHIIYIADVLLVDFFVGFGPEYHQRTIEDLEYNPESGNKDVVDFYEWVGPTYTEKKEPGLRISCGVNINLRINKVPH